MTAMYSGSSVILQPVQLLPLLFILMDATVSFEMSLELCQVVLHPSQKRTFLVDWGVQEQEAEGIFGPKWEDVRGGGKEYQWRGSFIRCAHHQMLIHRLND